MPVYKQNKQIYNSITYLYQQFCWQESEFSTLVQTISSNNALAIDQWPLFSKEAATELYMESGGLSATQVMPPSRLKASGQRLQFAKEEVEELKVMSFFEIAAVSCFTSLTKRRNRKHRRSDHLGEKK